MSEHIPILTKNQFKQTTRYLQEQLSKKIGSEIKLSTCQETLCRIMGFQDLHAYQHWISVTESTPKEEAEYANGDLVKEIQSLRFCLEVAQDGYSTAIRIRAILLHLYNNIWPCKIELKNFDKNHRIHILNVIALDSRANHEIHTWIPESETLFRQWSKNEKMTISQETGEMFVKFFLLSNDNRGGTSFLNHWKTFSRNDIDEEISDLDEISFERFVEKIERYF